MTTASEREGDSDAAMLRAWADGDQRAGARLYRRHVGCLTRFFRNKVAERDLSDLLQATFMRGFEHRERYDERASFRGFLLGFARNILLHHYRSHYRKHDKIDFGVNSVAELGVSPSTVIAERQDELRLLAALRSLPIEQQILLELFYWEGMQGQELADLLEVPLGTVRTRLRRARQLLAKAYETDLGPGTGPVSLVDLDGWAKSVRNNLAESE
ncbi:MAG: sigma-70 family RNA polymerase sigma factor [Myxococcales bacterium]|nr:sigma-70 family RNA polymerase sigma factor [Myxococcales bacterium]